MHAGLNLEAHLWHKNVTVGAQDGDVFKDNVIRESDLGSLGGLLENFTSFGLILSS